MDTETLIITQVVLDDFPGHAPGGYSDFMPVFCTFVIAAMVLSFFYVTGKNM